MAPRSKAQTKTPEAEQLLKLGWEPSDDGSLWFHQRKSRGEFLSEPDALAVEAKIADAALEVEQAARENPIDPDLLGPADTDGPAEPPVDWPNPLDANEPHEPPVDFVEPERMERGGVSSGYARDGGPAPLDTVESRAARADAEAREAAIERNESAAADGFAHDAVGGVIIWACYHCRASVRYALHCDCKRCTAITNAARKDGHCPFCNHPTPQVAAA